MWINFRADAGSGLEDGQEAKVTGNGTEPLSSVERAYVLIGSLAIISAISNRSLLVGIVIIFASSVYACALIIWSKSLMKKIKSAKYRGEQHD
jgi:hypothetical protein